MCGEPVNQSLLCVYNADGNSECEIQPIINLSVNINNFCQTEKDNRTAENNNFNRRRGYKFALQTNTTDFNGQHKTTMLNHCNHTH